VFIDYEGYNNMDGLSGGYLFGASGSGLITPRLGGTPHQSGRNTPAKGLPENPNTLAGMNLSTAFMGPEQGPLSA
jgi:hypothetical protein